MELLKKYKKINRMRRRESKDVTFRLVVMVTLYAVALVVLLYPFHSGKTPLYASSASLVAISPSRRKASSAPTASRDKSSFQKFRALRASSSEAVHQPILASCSPLSMNIDELARVRFGPRFDGTTRTLFSLHTQKHTLHLFLIVNFQFFCFQVLHGRGRALVSWDCYRQGVDPCLFYSSRVNATSTSDLLTNCHTEEIRPKCRATQGLGKESLVKLRKAFPYNPQKGTVEHSVASLSHTSTSHDGTTKLLIRMARDGLEVETVIIPWEKRKRSTVCIS